MSKDLDSLILEHYKKDKSQNVTPKLLLEMVEEAMDGLKNIQSITERRKSKVTSKEEKELSIVMPIIRLSEKEWGKEGTKDREILTNLLQRIIAKGKTLSEKITAINNFLTSPPIEGAEISEILSHIVFLDTLTNILVHFNASAAGFTFEGFLAALLEGEQVPAGTAGIQDIIDNEKAPISLKLLTESRGGDIHGSYADLISHFTDPTKASPLVADPETGKMINNPDYLGQSGVGGSMKYVIALKELSGEGSDELEGNIKFYEFDFSAETFLDALIQGPSKNHSLLLLPRNLGAEYETEAEPAEEFNPLGAPETDEYLNLGKDSRKVYNTMMSDMTPTAAWELWKTAEINKDEVWGGGSRRGQPRLKIVQRGTDKILYIPSGAIRGADPRFKKVAGLSMEGYMSYGESVKLLRYTLSSSEQAFWDLIGKTAGADLQSGEREETQFVVANRYYKKDYENGVGYLGQIGVGKSAITELANKYAEVLQQQIFDIFGLVQSLSAQLNGYFVAGDKEKGLEAARTAGKIERGTRKYYKEQEN